MITAITGSSSQIDGGTLTYDAVARARAVALISNDTRRDTEGEYTRQGDVLPETLIEDYKGIFVNASF